MRAIAGACYEEQALLAGLAGSQYTQRKPHAVVVPWPGQGHINPLLHLSKKLALHGFSITFVNVEYTHMRVVSSIRRQEEEEEGGSQLQQLLQEAKGTTYTSANLDIKFVSIPDGVPAEETRTCNVLELCEGVIRSCSAFEQLLEELQPPPTCIISDTFLLHTQDAANKFGIPRVSFWTQSAASYAAHLAAARGLIQVPSGSEEKLITNIAGAPPLRAKDLPSFLRCCDWSDFLFDFGVRPFLRTHEATCVLMNTFDEMEGKAMEVLRQQQGDCKFYTIGPILPMEYFSGNRLSKSFINKAPGLWAEDYTCLEWLDKQEEGSVLYVSFGSMTELSGQEMEEFALGLEASGLPVLWVLRHGSLEGGGHVALPPGFVQRTEGHVLIIEWAPQLHVLAHPSIAAFFTHGGWNSILEGVTQGKPMLGFPYFADQMLNCKCIEEEWGNGLALEQHGEGLLTRSLVESKVRTVMMDPKLRKTALQLRDSARCAILSNALGSSTANFNSFIQALAKTSNIGGKCFSA